MAIFESTEVRGGGLYSSSRLQFSTTIPGASVEAQQPFQQLETYEQNPFAPS